MIDWRGIEVDRRIVGVESAQVYVMRRRGTLVRSDQYRFFNNSIGLCRDLN